MELENTVNDVQGEVVAPDDNSQYDDTVAGDGFAEASDDGNVSGGGDGDLSEAVAQPRQNAETNARFAQMRRQLETYKKAAEDRQAQGGERVNEQLMAELEYYRGEQMKVCFKNDLDEIKASFPEETAGEITELGEEFMRLRANGVDNLTAYRATAEARKPKQSPPPEVGRVRGAGGESRGYYSSDELDNLSASALLSDEKVYKKAMRSLLHLK